MGCKTAVLLLLVVANLASAAELKLSGELHYNSLEVTLQNTVDHEVSFSLDFQLKEKASEWKLVEVLNCSVTGSVLPLSSKEFNCSYTTPEKPGQYKIYARADILNGTYTYKDFAFDVGDTGFKEPEPKEDVVIKILSAPEGVKTGEEFFVLVNVTAHKKADLQVYSYVYDGKTCYSFGGWNENAERYGFKEGESRVFNLSDSVIHDAVNGTYKLKVRAREGVGDGAKDYDLVQGLEVEQVPVDLFKELPKTQDQKSGTASSGLPIGILLPLLGSLPLLALAIKKML